LLNIFINHSFIDRLSNIILTVLTVLLVPYGNMTGLLFFIFILFSIKDKVDYYTYGTILLISVVISGLKQNVSVIQIVVILIGYSFLVGKYIFTIHKPTTELKALLQFKDSIISNLTTKLEILGAPEFLTDDQLLNKYHWLEYSGEDLYRKIKDIRDMGNGFSNQELAYRNGVEPDTQSKNLKRLKKEIGRETGIDILNNTHLVKICIELGIIQASIRP